MFPVQAARAYRNWSTRTVNSMLDAIPDHEYTRKDDDLAHIPARYNVRRDAAARALGYRADDLVIIIAKQAYNRS